MNKLVIFDLDGTLCNTLADIVYYANETLETFGYPKREYEKIKDAVCYSIEEIFSILSGEPLESDFPKKAAKYYTKRITEDRNPRATLYDGISEALTQLKKSGCKLAILTNKAKAELLVIYDRLLKQYGFDAIVGLEEGVVEKPNPTELYKLMQKFCVDKQNTYFVGDGDTDVLVANNAGVNLIAVTYGYRDKQTLQNLGASIFADSPQELLKLIP